LAESEEVVTFGTTEPFGENDPITGLGRSPDFNVAAFGLGKGAVSDPIKVPRGWSILQLEEVIEPRVPELTEVRARVQDAANQEQRVQAAMARLEELGGSVVEAPGLDSLATELGLEVQESGEFDRFGRITGLGANREVIDGALGLEAGQMGGPVKTTLGAVLYEVVERKRFDAAEFQADLESIRSRQETKQLNDLKRSLIELRWRDLTPAYGKQVLERFNIQPSNAAAG
jgi:parvulin-like peptidyl-prolyl isomerase